MYKFIFLAIFSFKDLSMEFKGEVISNNRMCAVIVPGLSGDGDGGANKILPKDIKTYKVEVPESLPDFGQGSCQKYLRKTLRPLLRDDQILSILIFAFSQGTATVLNYLSKHHHEKIKAVILEGVFASGNNTVYHYVLENKFIPGLYYIFPYLALPYIFYSSGGEQPILGAHKLPKIPIIMVHGTRDEALPYWSVEALYSGLKMSGHSFTYLLRQEDKFHFCMNEKAANTVKKILHKT